MPPSFSLVTVVRNNPQVTGAIKSILSQEHHGEVESIVIDGASTDGTLQALDPYRDRIARLVSEPDKGIYDAMNKGLRLASGDIIGLLNADDVYQDTRVFQRVARVFEDPSLEACYGDLVFVRQADPATVVRYWRGSAPDPDAFQWGWMPAHPTLFLRRSVYDRFGLFDPQYRIAADFEFMLRVLGKHRIKAVYIPEVLVRMRAGGISNGSLRGILAANAECRRAFRDLDLPLTPLFTPMKLARHAAQIFSRSPGHQGTDSDL